MDIRTSCMALYDRIQVEHEWNGAEWRAEVTGACEAFAAIWSAHTGEGDPGSQAGERAMVVRFLVQLADDLFYGNGESGAATSVYQLITAIDPASPEGYKGAIACHLQGSEIDPAAALPFAERLVALDPSRRGDLEYIKRLVAESRRGS